LIALSADCDDIARLQNGIELCLDNLATSANAFDKGAYAFGRAGLQFGYGLADVWAVGASA
jgi:hypothetical protein